MFEEETDIRFALVDQEGTIGDYTIILYKLIYTLNDETVEEEINL